MIEYYWSRIPGKFVDKTTGKEEVNPWTGKPYASFNGTSREWNETLIETIIDVGNCLQRGGADLSKVTLSSFPPVAMLMKQSVLYGIRSTSGLLLETEGNAVRPVVDFILNGKRVGRIFVLDLP